MDSIRTWVLTICVTLVGSSLFKMLVPSSEINKMAKFTINLFLISSLVSPILFNSLELDFTIISGEIDNNSNLEAVTDEQVYSQAEKQLKLQLEELFAQNGTKINDIEIDISISEEVQTVQIALWADSSERINQQKVEELVLDNIGVQPEIIYSDE